MSRKKRAVLLALGLLAVAGALAWRIDLLLRSGQNVFWLAELWAPSAVLSIGLVSCLEYVLPPKGSAKPVARRPQNPRRRRA